MLSGLLKHAWQRAAMRLRPAREASWRAKRGRELAAQGRYDLAEPELARAAALAPHAAPLWNKLGVARFELGLVDEAIAAYRHAIACAPGELEARRNLMFSLLLRSESPEEILAEHRACAAILEAAHPASPPARAPRRAERLRIGYVSADFRQHAVSRFMAPILEGHDPEACAVFCYDNRLAPNAGSPASPGIARWRGIRGLADAAAAAAIRGDEIDVLVDLSGHTGGSRLGLFARRCAPVQVSYLGYLATTGLSTMDWRLTDAFVDPPGQTEAHYTERLARLPGCLWCYRPSLPSAAAGWRERRDVTFASLNSSRKIGARILSLWGRVLAAVPGSRLLVAGVPAGAVRERILDQFQAEGVDAQRVECLPWMEAQAFAELHARVDVALDSYPYGGGTTTIEALWHGVPIVSLSGSTTPAGSGRSILNNVGLGELVAASERAYVEAAASLAADRARLARLHREAAERLRASPIMREPEFVRALEQAYRDMSH